MQERGGAPVGVGGCGAFLLLALLAAAVTIPLWPSLLAYLAVGGAVAYAASSFLLQALRIGTREERGALEAFALTVTFAIWTGSFILVPLVAVIALVTELIL